jgi:hypothetical protein
MKTEAETAKHCPTARKRCGKWYPSDTAPKTGQHFIAYCTRGGMLFTMHWDVKDSTFMTEYERWGGGFTHWMPLPKPPTQTQIDAVERKRHDENMRKVRLLHPEWFPTPTRATPARSL